MKNLTDLTLVKQTEKAFCFKGFEDTIFWCPKAWFKKDGFLKSAKEDEFKFNRRFALLKNKFSANEHFLKVEETEKAIKFATTITLFNESMTEVAQTFWCPKSCLNNFDFCYKKVEELKRRYTCGAGTSLDKLMNDVDWRADDL